MLRIKTPEWEPLLDLAPDHVEDFMWMFAVELENGTRVQAYKHYWTREYLYLDGDGRAFVYFDRSRYEEEDPGWLLSRAVGEDTLTKDWYHFVVQNDYEEIRSAGPDRRPSTGFHALVRSTSSDGADFALPTDPTAVPSGLTSPGFYFLEATRS